MFACPIHFNLMNRLKQNKKIVIDKYSTGYRSTIFPEIVFFSETENIKFLPGIKHGVTLIWKDG